MSCRVIVVRPGWMMSVRTLELWIVVMASVAFTAHAKPPLPFVGDWNPDHVTCRPVPLTEVRLQGFLGRHVDANNRRSLLAGLTSPIPAGIEARARGQQPPKACNRLATDSDFYKWLEGACYAIAYEPRLTEVARQVDRYVEMLVALQEPDGYLGTRLSPVQPFDTTVMHDLYVAGHFFEAAVAHYKATGDPRLINAAQRLADFYIKALEAGHPYYEQAGEREHPEIELALVRLGRVTGEPRFVTFSEDVAAMSHVGPRVADLKAGGGDRHAVRVCYLLTGLAELSIETNDAAHLRHVKQLFDEIVNTRMYVTGGIGYHEDIPLEPYDLPPYIPDHAYRDIAETCASVSFMMLAWRLHGMTGLSRYMDVVERILYNHYLGAISPDHMGNFYYNPLKLVGEVSPTKDHGSCPWQRRRMPEIHGTCCCLPNSWRFFGQLPEMVFSASPGMLRVNLYTSASLDHELASGQRVALAMETGYPHEGHIQLVLARMPVDEFTLALRIPAWCDGAKVTINAQAADARGVPGDYCKLTRKWQPGDVVTLELPMPPQVIVTRPEVQANRGQVAFQRGPLVYCLENVDAGGLPLDEAVAVFHREEPAADIAVVEDKTLGVNVLRVPIGRRPGIAGTLGPYATWSQLQPRGIKPRTLVPFYLRATRTDDSRWTTLIPYR